MKLTQAFGKSKFWADTSDYTRKLEHRELFTVTFIVHREGSKFTNGIERGVIIH